MAIGVLLALGACGARQRPLAASSPVAGNVGHRDPLPPVAVEQRGYALPVSPAPEPPPPWVYWPRLATPLLDARSAGPMPPGYLDALANRDPAALGRYARRHHGRWDLYRPAAHGETLACDRWSITMRRALDALHMEGAAVTERTEPDGRGVRERFDVSLEPDDGTAIVREADGSIHGGTLPELSFGGPNTEERASAREPWHPAALLRCLTWYVVLRFEGDRLVVGPGDGGGHAIRGYRPEATETWFLDRAACEAATATGASIVAQRAPRVGGCGEAG